VTCHHRPLARGEVPRARASQPDRSCPSGCGRSLTAVRWAGGSWNSEELILTGTNERQLFTLILDWRGGTYVSQVWAHSPRQAAVVWVEQDLFRPAIDLVANKRSQLQRDLEAVDNAPVPLAKTHNVWCVTTQLDGDLACLHLVKTQPSH